MDEAQTSTCQRGLVLNSEEELTNKFLNGEMTFAEYSNEWYDIEDEEMPSSPMSNDEDDISAIPNQLLKRDYPKRRRFTRLSAALLGLMGEANLRFVRGDKEMAEKMCHEVIKQMPTAPEPYQTLAQIYEDDADKSLQFSLIAAHLSPSDANEWLRLATISKDRDDPRQEMICYTQAIKAEPRNLENHLKRINLIKTLTEKNYSLHNLNVTLVRCYHKIVNCLPASKEEAIMKYARMATTLYHNNNEAERALEVMLGAHKKCSQKFTVEDTNILLELLISQKQYHTCIEIFVSNAGVEIEAEIKTLKTPDGCIEEHTNYINCLIPDSLPIDLRCKLLVCFIYLGAIDLVKSLINDFLKNDVEKAGDLFMDLEEALSSVGQHDLALQLLEPLINNTCFDLGAVWLKHADCLINLGREEDAISSYYKVLKHAPQHVETKQKLFQILEKRGNINEALNVLEQDYKLALSGQLLNEQLIALKKYNKTLKYLEIGEILLMKDFMRFRHLKELHIARRVKGAMDMIQNFRSVRGESFLDENDFRFDEEESFKLTPEMAWSLFLNLLQIAFQHKKYVTMQRLTYGALVAKNLSSYRTEIDFYCFQACLLTKDYSNALKFVRDFVYRYPSQAVYNLLNFVSNHNEETTYIKLSRLFQKDGNSVKNIYLGSNFLMTGRYMVALKYFLEYNEQVRDPLSALLIGITILIMAAQRIVDKHHNLVLHGISYLMNYQFLRKCDQETNYNMGRAYQMLGINNLATEYYERALNSGPICECPRHGVIDLTKETAYNLYILYKDHSPSMARKYLLKYLVI